MGLLYAGAYQSAVKNVQRRYANSNSQLANQIAQLEQERDAYRTEHDRFESALQYMAQNMGLSYEDVNTLCAIYMDELQAYLNMQ